ncbi:hypothetical protein ACQUZK_09240 [Streptococcus pyogenes]|uniref:hypothetical protein n=1 Tax=Streptococcus pyogenes TaxID=1314 RepID=UPI003DA19F29
MTNDLLNELVGGADASFAFVVAHAWTIYSPKDAARFVLDASLIRWLAQGRLPELARRTCVTELSKCEDPVICSTISVLSGPLYRQVVPEEVPCEDDPYFLSRTALFTPDLVGNASVPMKRKRFVDAMRSADFEDAAGLCVWLHLADTANADVYYAAGRHLAYAQQIRVAAISTELHLMKALREIECRS